MTQRMVEPRYLQLPTEEEMDGLTHIVWKDEWSKGYVEGKPITALCGYMWTPSKNPEDFPVCRWCQDVLNKILGRTDD